MGNTVQILYENKKKASSPAEQFLYYLFCLLGAMIIAWVPVILFYEIPCKIGSYFDLDISIIKAAVQAENKVTMKYRTQSYSVNKFIHELEEMKEFYSRL